MLNTLQLPALRLFAPYLAGVVLAFHFDFGWQLMAGAFLLALFALLLCTLLRSIFRTERIAKVFTGIALALLGYLNCWSSMELNRSDHFSHVEGRDLLALAGQISTAPEPGEKWTKAILNVSSVSHPPDFSEHTTVSGRVLVYLERDSLAELLTYGDEIILLREPQRIEPPRNPDAFDFSRYMHTQNVHYQVFARPGDWVLHRHRIGNRVISLAAQLQRRFIRTLKKYLPTTEEFAVASALILGYREELPDTVRNAYAQTGAMHVLAVSGLHVGIVFLILNFFLRKIKLKGRTWVVIRTLLILLGIWGFALVTGASPSVVRAATMFSIINIGMALERSAFIYNTLLISALILLLIQPLWLLSVGFQLSYLAVFGIVYFQRRFEQLLYFRNKLLRSAWTLITVSLGAQLMTAPVSIFYFRQFPVYFWLSSLILVPMAGFVLGGGLLLLLADAIAPPAALVIGKILWALLWFCNQTVYLIQELPGTIIDNLYLTSGQLILLYAILIAVMLMISLQYYSGLIWAASLVLVFACTTAFQTLKVNTHQEVVIYDLYGHTAIDFIFRNNAASILSADIPKKTLEFAAKSHRQKLGVRSNNSIAMGEPVQLTTGELVLRWPLVQFGELRMLIVDSPLQIHPQDETQVDILLLCNNAPVSLENILSEIKVKNVVVDGSNKRWLVEKWKKEALEAGILVHHTSVDGAFLQVM